MKQVIGNTEYTFLTNYQHDNKYRAAFNQLSKNVFCLSFEVWYQSGYWREKYIPYTLFKGEKAVANVSVNIMDFIALGKQQRYLQLGTIMTDENYRNKNLSWFLMDRVFEEWNQKCDFIYLFANGTVLDFYPKFGFRRASEYFYYKKIITPGGNRNYEKLDMNVQSNRDKLYDYVKTTKPCAKLAMNENADLVMFYCITVHKDNVYYIQSLDAFVVAEFNNDQLHLLGIFSKNQINLDMVISELSHSSVKEVLLGFTPEHSDSYDIKQIENDDYLFIQDNKTAIFDENKLMFPLLSHA